MSEWLETYVASDGRTYAYKQLPNGRGQIFRRAEIHGLISWRGLFHDFPKVSLRNPPWVNCRCDEFSKVLVAKGYADPQWQ